MKFGHWTVGQDGIYFDNGKSRYPVEPLNQNGFLHVIYAGKDVYDWLVHVPAKTWMTKQDCKDMWDAFFAAAAQASLQVDPQVKDNTRLYFNDIVAEKK